MDMCLSFIEETNSDINTRVSTPLLARVINVKPTQVGALNHELAGEWGFAEKSASIGDHTV